MEKVPTCLWTAANFISIACWFPSALPRDSARYRHFPTSVWRVKYSSFMVLSSAFFSCSRCRVCSNSVWAAWRLSSSYSERPTHTYTHTHTHIQHSITQNSSLWPSWHSLPLKGMVNENAWLTQLWQQKELLFRSMLKGDHSTFTLSWSFIRNSFIEGMQFNVWLFLFNYFLLRPRLQILGIASTFSCVVD